MNYTGLDNSNFSIDGFSFDPCNTARLINDKQDRENAMGLVLVLFAIPFGIAWCVVRVANFMKTLIHKRRRTNEKIVQEAQK